MKGARWLHIPPPVQPIAEVFNKSVGTASSARQAIEEIYKVATTEGITYMGEEHIQQPVDRQDVLAVQQAFELAIRHIDPIMFKAFIFTTFEEQQSQIKQAT